MEPAPEVAIEAAQPAPERHLRTTIRSGLKWSLGARVGQQVLQFAAVVVLAHLLVPRDFGVVGLLTIMTGFAYMLSDFGFASALVQRMEIEEIQVHSVFWAGMVTGLTLTVVMFFSAPLLVHFYDAPQLNSLDHALSITFFISSLSMVPQALLQRALMFDRLAACSLVATLISSCVTLVIAVAGGGAWALIFQNLSYVTVFTAAVYLAADWLPGRTFSVTALQELANYSLNFFGFNLINYWARNLDNLLIGKIFGPVALGLYSRAYLLMLIPTSQFTSVISTVMFPVLASIQDDHLRVKQVYLRAVKTISFIAFPSMVGMLTVARPFVLDLYGSRWAGVIPLIQVLALVGALQAVVSPVGWIYMSQGRTDWMLRWGLVGVTVLAASIVLGVLLGSVQSVAACYLAGNVLIFYPCIAIPGKLIGMRALEVFHALAGPALASGFMGCVVKVFGLELSRDVNNWVRLTSSIGIGMLAYLGTAHVFQMTVWKDALKLVRTRSMA